MFRKIVLASVLLASPAAAQTSYPSPIFNSITTPANPKFYGADPTGAADSVAAFTSLFSAVGANGGTANTPAGNYLMSTTVLPGPGNNFIPPYNPAFVRVPVASDLASQWLKFDPGAKFTGAGKVDLHYLFPYIGSPVTGDDVLIHTFTNADVAKGWGNYMVRSTTVFNTGSTPTNKMPVVADFANAISACTGAASNATLNCPVWAQNLSAFATNEYGTAWGTEIDVGDLSPGGTGTIWGVDLHAIGVNPSSFGYRLGSNQGAVSGWRFGMYLDGAGGHRAIASGGYAILANGVGWDVGHALAFDKWTYTQDELTLPQLFVGGATPITTPSYATTGASATGGVATITYTPGTYAPLPLQMVTVAGVTPTSYNGTFQLSANSSGSISYSCSTCSGAQTVAGTVSWTQSLVAARVKITGGTTAQGATAPKISVYRPYSWDSTGTFTDGDLRLGGTGAGQLLLESDIGTDIILDSVLASGANISSRKLKLNGFDSASAARNIQLFLTSSSTSPILQVIADTGSAIQFTLGSTTPKIASTGTSDLLLSGGGTGSVSITGGLKAAALPASAGAGGIFLCVDSAGVIYKKATCP